MGIVDPTAAAYGSYDVASNHISDFAVLKIETNASFSDLDQLYAAGFDSILEIRTQPREMPFSCRSYLEGAFTNAGIFDLYQNLLSTYSWAQTGPPKWSATSITTGILSSFYVILPTHVAIRSLTTWLDQQNTYVRANIKNPTGNIPFWEQLGLADE